MTRILPMLTMASIAVATLAVPLVPAYAAGSFDGNWIVTAPAVRETSAGGGCPGLRLPVAINDNQITGRWEYVSSGSGIPTVEAGHDRYSAPVTGTVQPDGSFTAQWMSFHATGKFTGDKVEMRWSGECGPRMASGGRV
jgi:hypothetical protein